MKPVAIFDFDGTLCDSFALFVETLNELAHVYRFRSVSPDEVAPLRELSTREIMRKLDIAMWKLPWIVRSARRRMRTRLAELPAFPGIRDALQELGRRGVRCGILTSNSEGLVREFIARESLPIHFIHAGSSLFGKPRALRRLLRAQAAVPGESWMIGDEIRDVEAARANGVRSVAVSWGYHSEAALARARPDRLLRSPGELVGAIVL